MPRELTVSGIEAVVLDVGGVLLLPDPAAIRGCLAPFGVSPSDQECASAHYAGMAVVDELGAADFAAANRAIVRRFGIPEAHLEEASTALGAAYQQPWAPVAGGCGELRRLRRAGIALAVVSNADGSVEAELLAHGICAVAGDAAGSDVPDVAVVVDSWLVGIEKPDPAIFSVALQALDVAPDRCIYVGDSVHFDVNGSTAAGLRPVHLTAMTGCHGPHAHARRLGDVVDAVLGENRRSASSW